MNPTNPKSPSVSFANNIPHALMQTSPVTHDVDRLTMAAGVLARWLLETIEVSQPDTDQREGGEGDTANSARRICENRDDENSARADFLGGGNG